MSADTTTTESQPLFTGLPSGIVPYVAILGALASVYAHFSLAPVLMQFDQTQAILFVLAGVGFLAGIAVYLSKFWRREFYLVAIAFALAQIVAWVVMSGRVSEMAILSKGGEAVFSAAAAYLYLSDSPETDGAA
ncbi:MULTISPECIES: hypothetical protein [unclassified Haloferax]|uniref:DUF7475 family protein n=1 Tax=unclassified Haloferax TaxID=2625095 RepID=UPI0002AF75B8|nr:MULTISPECIES: hypothetical protein [unclassified Haloferax]ELZ57943.1 hypothetical protein C460_11613 [Haloferax sp. ATCC BAA-646]ELZ62428.1 hypothetical protein C459_12994 [Haloferax sp. ATCC BAA-645]ELZ64085.1 hypothetical protein C458_14692 [Haloferax sp. ATCC BAA-644]